MCAGSSSYITHKWWFWRQKQTSEVSEYRQCISVSKLKKSKDPLKSIRNVKQIKDLYPAKTKLQYTTFHMLISRA